MELVDNIVSGLPSLFGNLYNTVLILIGLGAIVFIFLMIKKMGEFKHKFRVKEVVNGRKIIIDDRAKDHIDDKGVKYWKLMRLKDIIDVPPPEAIDITDKGVKCVEAYKTETGEYQYLTDIGKIAEVPKNIAEIKDTKKRNEKIEEWKKRNNVVEAYQPLTTKQRLILINQIKKAHERRTKRWQDVLPQIVSVGALVVIILALMIFWGELAQPVLTMKNKQVQHDKLIKEQMEIMRDIKNDVQRIEGGGKPGGEPPS